MAPTYRERSRKSDRTGEFFFADSGAHLAYTTKDDNLEYMLDVIGDKGGNHLCTHKKARVEGGLVNGVAYGVRALNVPGNLEPSWFTNYSIDQSRFGESLEALVTRHLAGAAPDEPLISLPESIGEQLSDFTSRLGRRHGFGIHTKLGPKGLASRRAPSSSDYASDTSFQEALSSFKRRIGRTSSQSPMETARELADYYLTWQFGLAPTISDLRKLGDFASAFQKRKKEIENLRNGGSRKRWTLGTGQYSDESSGRHDYGAYPILGLHADWNQRVVVQRSIYSRWRMNQYTEIPATDPDVRSQLVGMTAKGVTLAAWELVPWSWMADYFLNIGNFLKASYNSFGYEIDGGVCYHLKVGESHGGASYYRNAGDWGSVSAGSVEAQLFSRVPGLPGPTITWASSFLDARQLSILGAIGITNS